jgi:hypothetical protein
MKAGGIMGAETNGGMDISMNPKIERDREIILRGK